MAGISHLQGTRLLEDVSSKRSTALSKSFLKSCVVTLLLANGVGALFGGTTLIVHPDGSGIGLPLSILRYSPFVDFLIPGIILFVTNGVCSFIVLLIVLRKMPRSYLYVMAEGAILTGWIIVQVIMIRGVGALHFIFGGIGLALMGCGWAMNGQSVTKRSRGSIST